jgi:hypothetical protein
MLGVLAETPALPLHTAGKYVAAAYVVLFALVLVYVAIMAMRMSRIERDLGDLLAEAERSGSAGAARAGGLAGASGQDDPAGVGGGSAGAHTDGAQR